MKGARHRISVAPEYVVFLGQAAYIFATLEWNAVWCCERILPGYIRALSERTAGRIAEKFVELASTLPAGPDKDECCLAAEEFKQLVKQRNALLHAKPGTAPGGEQRLFRRGGAWSVTMIEDVADEFAASSLRLNALLHGALANLTTQSTPAAVRRWLAVRRGTAARRCRPPAPPEPSGPVSAAQLRCPLRLVR